MRKTNRHLEKTSNLELSNYFVLVFIVRCFQFQIDDTRKQREKARSAKFLETPAKNKRK
jgi:hypothetical protein